MRKYYIFRQMMKPKLVERHTRGRYLHQCAEPTEARGGAVVDLQVSCSSATRNLNHRRGGIHRYSCAQLCAACCCLACIRPRPRNWKIIDRVTTVALRLCSFPSVKGLSTAAALKSHDRSSCQKILSLCSQLWATESLHLTWRGNSYVICCFLHLLGAQTHHVSR